MKLLKGLLLSLVLIAVALIAIGYALPSKASLAREIEIDAPPEAVFAVLNSFERFNEWSPWAALDPATVYRYEGPSTGVGAIQRWQSENAQVGAGHQEIIASEPSHLISVALRFSGFDADNVSHYRLSPTEAGTRLVWDYHSDVGNQLLGRYFLLLLDGMLGPQYEAGLVRLKQLLESPVSG